MTIQKKNEIGFIEETKQNTGGRLDFKDYSGNISKICRGHYISINVLFGVNISSAPQQCLVNKADCPSQLLCLLYLLMRCLQTA